MLSAAEVLIFRLESLLSSSIKSQSWWGAILFYSPPSPSLSLSPVTNVWESCSLLTFLKCSQQCFLSSAGKLFLTNQTIIILIRLDERKRWNKDPGFAEWLTDFQTASAHYFMTYCHCNTRLEKNKILKEITSLIYLIYLLVTIGYMLRLSYSLRWLEFL